MKNADLIVTAQTVYFDGGVFTYECPFPGRAGDLDLTKFSDASEMGVWEACAYPSYGEDRCDAENIETLGDLFGEDFYVAWNRRRGVLLAEHNVRALEEEIIEKLDELAQWQFVIEHDNPGGKFAPELTTFSDEEADMQRIKACARILQKIAGLRQE